jgi:hypothetical protein
MEPINLGDDNFFTNDFNNDNFVNFDEEEDELGGIFDGLND